MSNPAATMTISGFLEVGAQARPRVKCVKTSFKINPGDLHRAEPFYASMHFMLQLCFTVKLQKCFVDYKTPPDFPSGEEMMTGFLG